MDKETEENYNMVVTMTPEKIHHEISAMISSGVPYIDALVEYAERNNLEIESIADVVKKSSILKEKIRSEAIDLRLVKKDQSTLSDVIDI